MLLKVANGFLQSSSSLDIISGAGFRSNFKSEWFNTLLQVSLVAVFIVFKLFLFG